MYELRWKLQDNKKLITAINLFNTKGQSIPEDASTIHFKK